MWVSRVGCCNQLGFEFNYFTTNLNAVRMKTFRPKTKSQADVADTAAYADEAM
jgi:hypothetical protein